MKNKRGQMQTQPMAKPAATPAVVKPIAKPMAQGMPGQANMPPKKSGFMKWLLIILGVLVVIGGISYWILAP